MMSRRTQAARTALLWLAVAGLYAYLVVTLTFRLGDFPALHGDEAWFGLFALRVRDRGLFSASGMTWYTGSIYGWLISQVFARTTPGVGSLRVVGVVLNGAALGLTAWRLGRRSGPGAALAWLAFWGATALVAVKSRVAWEVYALQPFLLTLAWMLVYDMLARERPSYWQTLATLTVLVAGVANHAIFLSVPFSLSVLLTTLLVREREWSLLPVWRVAAVALALSAGLLAAKFLFGDVVWQAHHQVVLGVAAGGLGLGSVIARSAVLDPWLQQAGERATDPRLLKRFLGPVVAIALTAFAILHGPSLFDVGSGVAVFGRVASWKPPLVVAAALYAFAAMVVALVVAGARRAWRDQRVELRSDRVVALWPIAYMATFLLFRLNAPVRHHLLLVWLLLAAATPELRRLAAPVKRLAAAILLVAFAAVQGLLWRELAHPTTRRPIEVRVGWMHDTSRHFVPIDPLYRAVEADHACRVVSHDVLLARCVEFFVATRGPACDPGKAIDAEYCVDCADPPYLSWKTHAD